MRTLTLATLAICVLASASVARAGGGGGGDPTEDQLGVLALTPENFDVTVGKDLPALVEFYAPWCGHCKSLVPEYAKLGKAVAASDTPKVIVAKVNADSHRELGTRFGVSGFPTIKYFPAGSLEPTDYNGGRDASSFISFLNEKANAGLFLPYEHSAAKALTGATLDAAVQDKKKKFVFVEFYAPWCGHCKSLAPTWEQLGQVFASEPSVTIAKMDADAAHNKGAAQKLGVQSFPTIKFYSDAQVEGDLRVAQDYNGGRSIEDLVEFVNQQASTHRSPDGGVSATYGTAAQLNALAAAFYKAPESEKATAREALAVAVKEAGSAFDFYLRAADSIVAKGAAWAEKELARLSKMLEGKMAQEKKDTMQMRKNVINAFLSE